jgi:hypothetical protein
VTPKLECLAGSTGRRSGGVRWRGLRRRLLTRQSSHSERARRPLQVAAAPAAPTG